MMQRDTALWSPNVLTPGGGTQTGSTNPNGRGAATLTGGASPATATAGTNSYPYLASGSPSVLLSGSTNGMGGATTVPMPTTASTHERSQELCKYYVNGGCLRGAQCQYLHELPDERHLDVNGYGYILNPNVHNAQKTIPLAASNNTTGTVQVNGGAATTTSSLLVGLTPGGNRQIISSKGKTQAHLMVGVPYQIPTTTAKASPPKYRPPEPFLEYNLPPTLALPLKTSPEDVARQLTCAILQTGLH
ncbi:ZFP family member, putative [Trypanosoma equiperdum]|uniref:C3H1-type domain-containing protein n=4 Tax=Trypanozoon TaxID=39700 RepID=Q57WV7_TRYB2|nr:hypothetical protein, conserved [Trypanosoma brucei gambiense DAL972]XP_843670.1 hypothetical protein, conserved [Trypanosoma brucei brucei TREU927]AAX69910.1 hypothetical protein, conserved [Trypanosoma brucei]RHW73860.1 ZFP family member [Trypanosoma brucei equiperdum]SCU66167.1 ZFP family member, putative [Trypanosoma equiperdum]AAZ10111.1 hypothetical protein, conserved [Trypanosoma brucei brucei TREU927]CBH09697.1 hypothetical protein, conserved [Trypanosoma brucei gambiense DAL972]|eukprot:XP_011771990.1 hypothetical protein, conserved [Trypanosoma brucei gambiense DAL972]